MSPPVSRSSSQSNLYSPDQNQAGPSSSYVGEREIKLGTPSDGTCISHLVGRLRECHPAAKAQEAVHDKGWSWLWSLFPFFSRSEKALCEIIFTIIGNILSSSDSSEREELDRLLKTEGENPRL